ncbi:3-phosphoserine/phosphohydroxythreonine transaminase [Psychroflexus gondwanensis]|uniref:3-phosphoserine/phosphohydroxythreonine transaminase n=1 Tax=Psychroflexus gondwanensis TaxID=251 RepID=UPI0011BDF9FE|nr:3-phosphoserine/phosphohydroxythreonine transaminase [Psychroflexus gondwanensis]TXE21010.1 3-phosphoserine/phosphohydroxythreonine transaminase [Psychroflexus gondwanensis]
MERPHNFSAGPCILPLEVFEKASQSVIDLDNSGLSILEISHRSTAFVGIIEKARELALEHLNLQGKGYKALFLQGGASLQFLMTAYNLLEKKAGYLDTGTWSSNAIKEANNFGETEVLASSKSSNYNYIPKDFSIPEGLDYLHYTSNNTIYGTQMKTFPKKANTPLVCDMSSDIFSRQLDYSQFDLIYAGAQKNMGPAGATLVVVKEDILGKVSRAIPSMMDYQLMIKRESMFNTPPVFSVYVSMLNLEWLSRNGGVPSIEKKNQAKADLIYSEIDRNPLFKGFTALEDRSMMNATFSLKEKQLGPKFDELWKASHINGLSGHRSVGGYRASMYNALTLDSVKVLVDVMKHFEKTA